MKIKFFAVLSLSFLALASCKKDRSCECTVSSGSDKYVDASGTYKKVTKQFMKNQVGCVSYEYVSESGNVTNYDCEIK